MAEISPFLRHVTTAEKYLLSSTRFWSLLSAVAVTGALSSLYSTEYYTNSLTVSGKYIISATIFCHLILFFSDLQTLKNTIAPFFLGSAKKWAIRITAVRAAAVLQIVPEQSEIGLLFVICVWIDAVAVSRIVGYSNDLWFVNAVFMAVVMRGIELYGFSGCYWLVMLFCYPLILVQTRLEGYVDKGDEVEKKEE